MKSGHVRWTLSAALVATAHVLMVYELARRGPVLESEAGSPVITLDLSPIPAAPASEQTPDDSAAESAPAQAATASEPTPSPQLTPTTTPLETPPAALTPSAKEPPRSPSPEPSQTPLDTTQTPPPPALSPPPRTPPPSPAHPPPPPPTPSPEPLREAPSEAADAAPPNRVVAPSRAAEPRAAPGREEATARATNRSWVGVMIAQIERRKSFPLGAKGRAGVVSVAFTIDRSGHLTQVRLQRSSGDATLDEAALDLIRRSQPFPPPPATLSVRELSIVSSFRFLRPQPRPDVHHSLYPHM